MATTSLSPNMDGELDTSFQQASDQEALFRRIAIYLGEHKPTGSLSFSYLTEGAANTIWLIHFHNSNLAKHDGSLVLRMRKDLPSTVPMSALKKQHEECIAPLFLFDSSLLLPVHLVQINAGLVESLNDKLHELEDATRRKELRIGVYHPSFAEEPYAMIMPNLGHGGARVVEFKPKWLVQSPSAPKDAHVCRTCALNARRRTKGGNGRGDGGFCPFDLLSPDCSILRAALEQLWFDEATLGKFVDAFKKRVQPVLREIQKLQRMKGTVGLEDFLNPEGKDFGIAMALRDCSVVAKVEPVDQHEGDELDITTVKLLDLDLKDPGGGKLEKWASMEQELVTVGWYTTTDPSVKCAIAFQ